MKNQKKQAVTHSSVVGYASLVIFAIGLTIAALTFLDPIVSGVVGNVGALLAGK